MLIVCVCLSLSVCMFVCVIKKYLCLYMSVCMFWVSFARFLLSKGVRKKETKLLPNHQKIMRNSSPNHPQISKSTGHFEVTGLLVPKVTVLGGLGTILALSWGALGGFWCKLRPFQVLEAPKRTPTAHIQ